jgi:hypothetical protein
MSVKIVDFSDTENNKNRFDWMPKVQVFEEPDQGANKSRKQITLKYSDVDEYHGNVLKSIAESLPDLMKSVRNEEFSERVSQLIRAYRPADPLGDIHISVVENGLIAKRELVSKYAMLNAYGVESRARKAGLTKEVLAQTWRDEKKIFSIDYYGIELFPDFQFHEGVPIPLVQKIILLFEAANYSRWDIAVWFTQPTGWLDDARPVDQLLTHPEAVLDAAEQYVAPDC